MSIAKGGRGVKAPYASEMYRIPSPIKPAVMQLAELYRQGLWDGNLESLQTTQEQDYISLLTDIKALISGYEDRIEDTCNRTEIQNLLDALKKVLPSEDHLLEPCS